MELKFRQLLIDYLDNCINIKQKMNRKGLSENDKNFLEGQRHQNLLDFKRMKYYYIDEDEMFTSRLSTEKDSKKYKIKGDYPLVEIFEYRGQIVPVYFDDYGQQMFAIYKGKELPGGAYEAQPYCWLSDEIDSYLEKEFFESNKEYPKGWKKLLKEYKEEIGQIDK